jgi:endonuclease YncB( thermonuclease family)
VLRVWDGNTVLIDGGLTVRYIGVETPGGNMFNRPLEPFGKEAAERNVALVEGKDVELELDVNDVDSNGFLLRYVYVGNTMINEVLLREGLGKLGPVSADRKYRGALEAAQETARVVPLNVWTVVAPTARPTSTPTMTPTPGAATPTPAGGPSPVASPTRTSTTVPGGAAPNATPTHVVLTLTPTPSPTPRE